MKIRLTTLVFFLFAVGLFLAWYADRRNQAETLHRMNIDAAEVAVELYIARMAIIKKKPTGAFINPLLQPLLSQTGEMLDSTNPSDRKQILERLKKGESNFLVRTPKGGTVKYEDVLDLNFLKPSIWVVRRYSLIGRFSSKKFPSLLNEFPCAKTEQY